MRRKSLIRKECMECGKPFMGISTKKYCTPVCRRKHEPYYINREELTHNCLLCGKEFKTFKSTQKYCSSRCRIEYNKVKAIPLHVCPHCGKEI